MQKSLPKFTFEGKNDAFGVKIRPKSEFIEFEMNGKIRYCLVAERKLNGEGRRRIMCIKSGKIEGFEQYSQFESLKEFNHHMEMWMLDCKTDFSKGEIVGLKRLVRFAAKIPGVCNAKIGTVLKAIHDEYNDNGISRSTFKRMINKAKALGIFTAYETERKNGSQSSNLYVFNRFPVSEPPKQEILNQPKETINLLKTEKDQKIKKRNEEPSVLDHTYVSNRVPQRFVQFVQYFFSDAKLIEEYWRMAYIQIHRLIDMDIDDVVDIAIDSFRQLIRKLKFTKVVRNPISYYYGIFNKKLFHFFRDCYWNS